MADMYAITHERVSEKLTTIKVHIDGGYVLMKAFKDMVGVHFVEARPANFAKSVGMMGSFKTGELLSRNGTVMDDTDAFGKEWQVRDTEPKLFQATRSPQFPEPVVMPNLEAQQSRRLGESVSEEAARKACSAAVVPEERFDHCVYDVIAVGDLEIAQAGVF